MSEEFNKELCGLLGICRHEMVDSSTSKDIKPEAILLHCSCGAKLNPIEWPGHEHRSNPDFTSDPVALLREIRKHKDGISFFWRLNGNRRYVSALKMNDVIPIDLLLDNTGKLAIAARDFLRKEKK